MKNLIWKIILCLPILNPVFGQTQSNCSDGQVGVIVVVNTVFPGTEVSWDIQNSDGDIMATNPFIYAANFTYYSDEICLPEGEAYTFNSYDSGGDGWGSGAWYEVAICGGNTVLIDNNGFPPTGSGNTEDFSLPVVTDDCFCFSAELVQSNASSDIAEDGSITTNIFAGNPPFTYEWSNGATTQNLSNVASGLYILTITDSLGCELSVSEEVQGPSIYMGPFDVQACTGYFYDSGGPNNQFSTYEDFTMTICSADPDLSSSLNFYSFSLGGSQWNSPSFTIYDGDSPLAPVLYSYDSPNDPSPGIIQATDANTSGCLTVVFSSTSGVSDGWFAEVNCQYPCQEYTIEIVSDDNITANGELDACYDVELEVVTDYFNNNTYYTQEDVTTSFDWTLGDDNTYSGQSLTHLYGDQGEYELSVVVTDMNDCVQEASLTVVYDNPGIITSFIPPSENEVCPDTELVASSGMYSGPDGVLLSFFEPIVWYVEEDIVDYGEEFGEPIYLPDGLESYTTSLNVQAFDPFAVLDDNDFLEVCIELEHSYLGDLQMELTAPSGSNVILHSYGSGGGSTWLGDAIDGNSEEISGECWEYCWSADPDFGTFANSLGNTMIAPVNGGTSMIPGAYTPEDSFANFAGSSANGTWTLTVTDNLLIDNGFICGWNMAMNVVNDSITEPAIVDSLVPSILSYNWYCPEDPSSIVSYDSTSVTVQPSDPGTFNYILSMLDNFGCEYSESFDVSVYQIPSTIPDFISYCEPTFDIEVNNVPPFGGEWELVSSPQDAVVTFAPNNTSLDPSITVSEVGEYTFLFTDTECKLSDELEVEVFVVNPEINSPTVVTCELENSISVINPTSNGGIWSIHPVDTAQSAVIENLTALNTNVSVTDFGYYDVIYTIDFCHGTDTVQMHFETVDPAIVGPEELICDFDIDLFAINPSPTGGSWIINDQPNHTSVETSNLDQQGLDISVDNFGVYEFLYTIDGCETSDSLTIDFQRKLPVVYVDDLVRCDLMTDLEVKTYGMDQGWSFISGPDVATITNPNDTETTVVVDTYGDYTLAYTSCKSTVEFNVLFLCDLIIPNVFTPNGDLQNDFFVVDGLTEEFYSYSNMSVYNKWGDEVYRNGSYGIDGSWWDGQTTHQNDPLTDGVYFYVLRVGNKATEEEDLYRGTVHLFQQ